MRYFAILILLFSIHFLAENSHGDITITSYDFWTSSRAQLRDLTTNDYQRGAIQTNQFDAVSHIVDSDFPTAPCAARTTGVGVVEIVLGPRALIASGFTVSENEYVQEQCNDVPLMYSEAIIHLEFDFIVEGTSTVLEHFFYSGNEWSLMELRNVNTGLLVDPGDNIVLDSGSYSFVFHQFEFRQGSHSEAQNGDPFSFTLVDGSAIHVVPEPTATIVIGAVLSLMLASRRNRRRDNC